MLSGEAKAISDYQPIDPAYRNIDYLAYGTNIICKAVAAGFCPEEDMKLTSRHLAYFLLYAEYDVLSMKPDFSAEQINWSENADGIPRSDSDHPIVSKIIREAELVIAALTETGQAMMPFPRWSPA